MATVRNVMVRLGVQERGFSRGFRAATQDVRRFQRQTDMSMARVGVSVRGAGKAVDGLKNVVGSLTKGIGTGFKVAAAVGGLAALAGSAAVATQSILQLSAALAPMAGLLVAIPGAVGLAAVAFATLKLATSKVGDAFEAAIVGDAEKFKQALKDLAPAARVVAREVSKLRPVLLGIRNTAQQRLFEPLRGELTATAKVLRGPLTIGVGWVAREFGRAAKEAFRFAREARTAAGIKALFRDTALSIRNLKPAIDPLLSGFRDIAVVGARFLTSMTPALGAAVASFGRFLSAAAQSGQAMEWMQTGLSVLQQFARILGNVGSIIGSVFRAANETGGGLLGTIEQLTGKFADFLKSTEGVRTLRSIFSGIGDIGRALGPVVIALAKGLGLVAPAFGRIAQVIGPILTRAINALAPALAALEPGITALLGGLGGAVTALAPALVPLADALSRIAGAAAPLLASVAAALAPALLQLEPGITALVNGLGGLVDAIAPALIPVAQALSGIAAGLAPVLPALGLLVASLAQGLAVHIQNMLPVLPRLVDAIIKLGLALGVNLLRVIEQLGPQLPALVVAFSDLLLALIPVLPPLADFLIALVPLIPIVTDVIKFISELANVVMPALRNSIELNAKSLKVFLDAVKWVVDQVYKAFSWLFDVLVGHSIIPDLVNGITRWFRDGARWMVSAFTSGITNLVRAAASLPGRVLNALGNLGGMLYRAGQSVINGLINGLVSRFNALARTASSIGEIIARYLPGSPVREGPLRVLNNGYAGGQIASMLAAGMTQGQRMVVRAASGLAGASVLSPGQTGLAVAGPGLPQPRGAAFTGGPAIDEGRLARLVAREVAEAMRGVTVESHIDGQKVTDVVSRRQGQTTAMRRRSG